MGRTRENAGQIDWSTFSLNIKSAKTTSVVTPANGTSTDLGPSGASVSFTVETTCYALVIVDVGLSSTSDYEHKPQIWLDGALASQSDASASISGGTAGRAFQRTHSMPVQLTAGTHTLSAGVYTSSATGQSIPSGAGHITALVLGRVTA